MIDTDDAPADAGPDDAPSEADTRPFRSEPFGEVTIRYDLDAETYRRVLAAYWRARRAGYEDPIDLFIYNRCEHVETVVTVDGEPVDPEPDVEEWLDLDASDPRSEDPVGRIADVRDALDELLAAGDLQDERAEAALREHLRTLRQDVPTVGYGVDEATDLLEEALDEDGERVYLLHLARDVLNPPTDD